MNNFIDGGLIVGLILMAFFAGLLLALPLGNWLARRMDKWPNRPMDPGEMRAMWAWKYYQLKRAIPNTWDWKRMKEKAQGNFTAGVKISEPMTFNKGGGDYRWLDPNGGKQND